MKKNRLVGLILSLMTFTASVLTGCGLVTINQRAYQYKVVATVVDKDTGDKLEVYKKDLISAYESYGYYYNVYYGETKKKAYEKTLELLVNRKMTINESEKLYPKLTDMEKTYLWQQTAQALEDNYKTYLNRLLGISENSDEQSADARKFTDYSPNAEFNKEDFTITKLNVPQTVMEQFASEYDPQHPHDAKEEADMELIYTNFVDYVNSVESTNRTKAFNNYLKALKKQEDGLKLSTDPKSVFMREIERLSTVVYENYMITKYDEYYQNHEYDPEYDNTISTITVDQVLDLYSRMVKSAYTQYEIERDSSYESNMQSNPSSIYYYREDQDDTKFFQVAHILFKFNDEADEYGMTASDYYRDVKTKYENGGYYTSESDYQDDLDEIIAKITPIVRENVNGEYIEQDSAEGLNAYELAWSIKNDIDNNFSSLESKVEQFREYIYCYNDDPGQINNMSGSTNYTIGVNTAEAEEGEKYKVYSNFVTEFTDAAVDLYENGKVGAVSGPVVTENGVHVLFYLGEVTNLFPNIDENFTLVNEKPEQDVPDDWQYPIITLTTSRPNLFNSKSYFDIVYDTLDVDNFGTFQNRNMKALTDLYKVDYKASAYADLIK